MKHEADGLYFVDAEMLRKARACAKHLRRWTRFYGKRRVPLTLAVAERMQRGGEYIAEWAVEKMWIKDLIDYVEYLDLDRGKPPATCLMDILAARARREGRLA